jgi:hypothetical protein
VSSQEGLSSIRAQALTADLLTFVNQTERTIAKSSAQHVAPIVIGMLASDAIVLIVEQAPETRLLHDLPHKGTAARYMKGNELRTEPRSDVLKHCGGQLYQPTLS